MNIIKLKVTQEHYECDEYGRIECRPQSIKVTVIRLYRAVTELGLKDCKDNCEELFGSGPLRKIEGRVTMTMFCDDAALGRLYKLVHWYQHDVKNVGSVVEVESLEDIGKAIVGVTT